jgi:hypothetical protein
MRRRLWAVAFVLSCAVASAATASERWESAELRCSIGVPDGWHIVPPPYPVAAAMIARSADELKSVGVVVIPTNNKLLVGEALERGIMKSGGNATKVGSSDFVYEGRAAHRLICTATMAGRPVSLVYVTLWSHRRLYSICVTSMDGDADKDTELNSCLNSFHLMDPPDPPDAGAMPDNRNWSEKASEKIGECVGFLIVVIIAVYIFQRFKR